MGLPSSTAAHLRRHIDLAGVTASGLCLIHCLLTPVAISLFPEVIPYLPGDTSFHRILAVAVVLCGVVGFIPGYVEHRRKPLLLLIACGMSFVLVVAWNGAMISKSLELALSIPGSLLLVIAHLLNRSFCRQCRACIDHPEVCQTTSIQ